MLLESKNTFGGPHSTKITKKKLIPICWILLPYFLSRSKDLEEPEPEALPPVGVESSIQSNLQTFNSNHHQK